MKKENQIPDNERKEGSRYGRQKGKRNRMRGEYTARRGAE
jgi:hypothetical protein